MASHIHTLRAQVLHCADGLVAFCERLGVDPAADVEILVLTWKCRASQQACLTREEFVSGLTAVGCACTHAHTAKHTTTHTHAHTHTSTPAPVHARTSH